MDAVRLGQAEDLRDALRRLGPASVAELSAEAVLSIWSVKSRLAERPEWFRCAGGDRWELAT